MALEVTGDFTTPIGTTVATTYWRWVGLGVDVSRATATVTLYAYVNAEAFAAGKQNIGQKQFSVTGADFLAFATAVDGETPAKLSDTIYNYVKANDEYFAEAKEV